MTRHNSDIEKFRDGTVEEIHQIRARIAEKCDGDLAAIIKAAERRQQLSGRAVWQRIASTGILNWQSSSR